MKQIELIKNRSSKYCILLPQNPTDNERLAAEELCKYLFQATGVKLSIKEECAKKVDKFIALGSTEAFSSLGIMLDEKQLHYDGFLIQTIQENIYINAANRRGLLYGVCGFLEKFVGVKFLAPAETFVPNLENVTVPEGKIVEKPLFRYRNFYDGGLFFSNENPHYADLMYGVHKRMYSDFSHTNKTWGYDDVWYKGINTVHNILLYVPKEKYGETHPEFYSSYTNRHIHFDDICYLNGLNDDGSVDESMAESAFKVVLERLKGFILESEEAKFFTIGISDANDYCLCARCERVREKYGERSATVCMFVNALSREIEKWEKEKGIVRETNLIIYAYAWCLPAPVKKREGKYVVADELKLENNVFVRYCVLNEGYNFAYGVNDSRQVKEAKENLYKWSLLSKNLMIWEYCANYDAYFWYFPCLYYMADNVKFYKEVNAQYVMTLSGYTVYREWSTLLRGYVEAKLYWDENLDVYQAAYEFIDAYHGQFAPYVRQFFDSFENHFAKLIARGDFVVNMNDGGDMGIQNHPLSWLQENYNTLQKGLAAVQASALSKEEKATHTKRITLALLIPQFMILRNYEAFGLKNWDEFFGEFVAGLRLCGLLTEEIENQFREGWSLKRLVADPELVNVSTSRRYKLQCVDLIINQNLPIDVVSKRVKQEIPLLEEWVKLYYDDVKGKDVINYD